MFTRWEGLRARFPWGGKLIGNTLVVYEKAFLALVIGRFVEYERVIMVDIFVKA